MTSVRVSIRIETHPDNAELVASLIRNRLGDVLEEVQVGKEYRNRVGHDVRIYLNAVMPKVEDCRGER